MAYYVYILRCRDGSLYTGSTNNVERRLAVHQSGKGAKYTRSRLPVELVYQETWSDRSAALRREAAIKRLERAEKLTLIQKGNQGMLKKDLERPAEFAWEVVEKSDYGVMAMVAEDGTPYAVPLSVVRVGDCVYFHCATKGKKVDCLRKNPRVSLTCVGNTELYQDRFTVLYSSAIATGTVYEVEELEEKKMALRKICARYAPDKTNVEETVEGGVGHTGIWKMVVDKITGKTNRDFYNQ